MKNFAAISTLFICCVGNAAVIETNSLRLVYPDSLDRTVVNDALVLTGAKQQARLSSIGTRLTGKDAEIWLTEVSAQGKAMAQQVATSGGHTLKSEPVEVPMEGGGLVYKIGSYDTSHQHYLLQYIFTGRNSSVYLTYEGVGTYENGERDAQQLANGLKWK